MVAAWERRTIKMVSRGVRDPQRRIALDLHAQDVQGHMLVVEGFRAVLIPRSWNGTCSGRSSARHRGLSSEFP